jgi:mono/diheme cytochrome c family protein
MNRPKDFKGLRANQFSAAAAYMSRLAEFHWQSIAIGLCRRARTLDLAGLEPQAFGAERASWLPDIACSPRELPSYHARRFAIATYLKDLPDSKDNRANPQPQKLDANVAKSGEAIYLDQCAACHRSSGEGVPGYFPPLKGSANAQQYDPTTVLRLILEGARSVPTDLRPTPLSMPAFDWKLSDEQIAVANYVRNTWGNSAPVVSPSQVKDLRGKLPLSAAR